MMNVLYKKVSLIVGLLLIFSVVGQGNTIRFEQIDEHARNAPANVTNDVNELAAYLAGPATNDLEKVRSFYVWIAENITYDVRTFLHYNPNRYQKVAPNEVLDKRKAVCQGYAELFQAMCQLNDIPCYLIPGYSKGFNVGNKDFAHADHAWNAVNIDGQWHLLDVTWGSGGLTDQLKFVKEFNEAYFLTAPEIFIRDHMPLDPMWQLLDCPVSMASFVAGEEAIQQELAAASAACKKPSLSISDFEQSNPDERDLLSAQRAYDFNPDNSLVLVHAYMNRAHHLMSSIPQQLRSRVAIENALQVQEEALVYLEKAQAVIGRTRKGEAEQEKKVLKMNLENSQNNLRGLREALKQ